MASGILQWLLPTALAGLMLGVGLTVSLDELLAAARERRTLLAVLVSMQVVLPAATLVAAWAFHIDSTTATGLVLLASCPGGLFSNYLTALGGGSVPLSIVLTVLVTLVYAAAAPLWASAAILAFAPDVAPLHHYSPRELLSSLCAFVLAPVVVGIALRSRAPRWAAGAARYLREPAAVALLVCYGLVLYEMRHTLAAGFAAAAAPVLAFNAAALLAAAVTIRVSRVSPPQQLPVRIEHLVRQEGTGVYIATALLGVPAMTYPMLVNSITGFMIASIVVAVARFRRGSSVAASG